MNECFEGYEGYRGERGCVGERHFWWHSILANTFQMLEERRKNSEVVSEERVKPKSEDAVAGLEGKSVMELLTAWTVTAKSRPRGWGRLEGKG